MRKTAKKMTPMGLKKVDVIHPTLVFDEEQLPEIENWKVGEDYKLVIKVKQKKVRITDDDKIKARFDVLKVGAKD